MSIASEITRINNNIAGAYTACNNKGATIPQAQNSANLATTISSIPTGTTPTGSLTITQDGTYDVTNYAEVVVNTMPHTLLNYIQGTGTQRITTDFMPDHNTKYEIKMSDIDFIAWRPFFGAWVAYDVNNVIFNSQVNATIFRWYYTSTPIQWTENNPTAEHTYTFYRGTITKDGTTISSNTNINNVIVFDYLTIFGSSRDTARCSAFKLKELKCYDNLTNTLLHWYRPVRKDGIVCIYDQVYNKYFYNEGTGDFIGG